MKKGGTKYRSRGTSKYDTGRAVSRKGINVVYADKGANKVSGRKPETN